MPFIFLHEYLTAGGALSSSLSESLFREGRAMISALAEDFSEIPGCKVCVMLDHRLENFFPSAIEVHSIHDPEQEQRVFQELSARADWTVVIAPEFSGIMAERCRLVEQSGGKLLGGNSRFVEIASDKHHVARLLTRAGLRTPEGISLHSGESLPKEFIYPAVLKPADGAGSLGVQRIDSPTFFPVIPPLPEECRGPWRLEAFQPGLAVSVALLCGPEGILTLPCCRQQLSDDALFQYQGGMLPIEEFLSHRAGRLARRAVEVLQIEGSHALGYVGVDLVLDIEESGNSDTVIEINPRLTTSYVGLRKSCRGNLAFAILNQAEGKPHQMEFSRDPIQFFADGTTQMEDREAFLLG